jgi:hypothetical protein
MPDQPKKLRRQRPKKPASVHRRSMVKVYTTFYRRRLRTRGMPDRREVAEALLRTVLLCSNGSEKSVERSTARTLLDRSGRLLLEKIDENGNPKFKRRQIQLRWDRLLNEIEQSLSVG